MLDQVLNKVIGRCQVFGTDCAVIGVPRYIQPRMMGANVFPQHYPLVKGAWADGAGIWLLAGVDSLVLPQSTTIRESLPAVAAAIWPLTGVDPYVNLLGTARTKCLSAFEARKKLARRSSAVRVSMVGERTTVGEFFLAHLAYNRLVPMRSHVPL